MRRKDVMSDNSPPALHGGRTLREFLCALLALSLVAGHAFAGQSAPAPQPASGERSKADTREARAQLQWERLQTLGPAKGIEVETRTGAGDRRQKTLRGSLAKWTPDGLVLQDGNGKRTEIDKSRVGLIALRASGRAAAIGGAIGIGIGVPIGVAVAGTRDKTGSARAAGGLVAGALFGVIGALLGRSDSRARRTILYEAP
jgi:hypothetical protein